MRRIRNQWQVGRAGEDFFWHFGGLHDGIEMIRRFEDKQEQEVKGDFHVIIDGTDKNVDAKVEEVLSANFVVELVQDCTTGDPGWFIKLTDCDEIWTAQANKDELAPFGLAFWSIWRVSLPRLRDMFGKHSKTWRDYETNKGWGNTKGKLVSYTELIERNTALLWWGWHYTGPFQNLGDGNV